MFTDAGKYSFIAEISGDNDPNDRNYQSNGTFVLNAVKGGQTIKIDQIDGYMHKLDGETLQGEITVNSGDAVEFDMSIKTTSGQIRYDSFSLVNVNIIRTE